MSDLESTSDDSTDGQADGVDSFDNTGETPVVGPAARQRSWGQRVLLGVNCVVVLACFAAAIGLLVGRHYGNSLARVELDPNAVSVESTVPGTGSVTGDTATGVVDTATGSTVAEAFPDADPEAKNFLITGADNNACLDPDSPFALAFGDRESMGERSDTIMLMRVDPTNNTAAVLSFPRDLYVQVAGRGKGRINTAYVRNEPQVLIDTIAQNFVLGVDHFIQVDFCAFKAIVDAVDGVTIPFEYPARDENTGLYVPEPGCFTFEGEHALAYVRSRHYEYFVDGKWKGDGTSDLGRISRQQDFLRRVLASALSKGWNPGVARQIVGAVQDYVVVDDALTPADILEFAGLVSDIDPDSIATYQIAAENQVVGGSAVLIPRIKSDNMVAILEIFRGQAPMAGGDTDTTAPADTVPTETTVPTGTVGPTITAPVVTEPPVTAPSDTAIGVVPPEDVDCS